MSTTQQQYSTFRYAITNATVDSIAETILWTNCIIHDIINAASYIHCHNCGTYT